MKQFFIRYKTEVIAICVVDAKDEKEALEKFKKGEYQDELLVDTINKEFIRFEN